MEAIMLLLGYETSWNVIFIWYDMIFLKCLQNEEGAGPVYGLIDTLQ